MESMSGDDCVYYSRQPLELKVSLEDIVQLLFGDWSGLKSGLQS